MKKHYYAVIDWTMENEWQNYGYGFANTKKAVAFESKKARTDFLDKTFDLSARVCLRKEAVKFAQPLIFDCRKKAVELYPKAESFESQRFVVLIDLK
jgi:hypothetical protein